MLAALLASTLVLPFTAPQTPAPAAAQTFTFEDPKGVNAITFTLDSLVEPIQGVAGGIAGSVSFDPAAPEKTTGTISADLSRLTFVNGQMGEKAMTGDWLDTASHPQISFELMKAEKPKADGANAWTADVKGKLTCKGTTKELVVPVRVTYLKDALSKRLGRMEGDLLVLRTEFAIKRSDFGIAPDMDTEVVSDEVQLRMAIVGMCPRE